MSRRKRKKSYARQRLEERRKARGDNTPILNQKDPLAGKDIEIEDDEEIQDDTYEPNAEEYDDEEEEETEQSDPKSKPERTTPETKPAKTKPVKKTIADKEIEDLEPDIVQSVKCGSCGKLFAIDSPSLLVFKGIIQFGVEKGSFRLDSSKEASVMCVDCLLDYPNTIEQVREEDEDEAEGE